MNVDPLIVVSFVFGVPLMVVAWAILKWNKNIINKDNKIVMFFIFNFIKKLLNFSYYSLLSKILFSSSINMSVE